MKYRNHKITLALLFLVFLLAACVAQPIYNVENATIISSTDKNLSSEEIRGAIIKAGATRGWVVKEKEPGLLVGTLFVRKHMAKVDIKYSEKAYSIAYKDSENLNYDGANVHRNYNNWIKNLQRDIEVQLNILTL